MVQAEASTPEGRGVAPPAHPSIGTVAACVAIAAEALMPLATSVAVILYQ
jgi:hypothetical protein